MQTICGLSSLNMSILRYIRHRRCRTDRRLNNIKDYLNDCIQECDKSTTRLVVRLLIEIVNAPDRQNLLVAFPVIVSLARRGPNTLFDRRVLSAFFILGQCLSH